MMPTFMGASAVRNGTAAAGAVQGAGRSHV
jgi:hypothetical protein